MQIPDFTPVERFVREVIPAIPGGLQRVTNFSDHLELLEKAAADRGLTTKVIDNTTYYFDGRFPVGGMTGWVPTLVGREALVISHSKDLTRQMLEAAGVPIPAGISMDIGDFDDGLAHVQSAERPMVLKPDVGKGGSGITGGITSEPELRAAWETAEATGKSTTFVLEEQITGIDIRAYVVGERVVAAVTRVNAHVVGDGTRSLAELIEEKQRLRDEHNARLAEYPIVVDADLLRRCGRKLHDVPARGDVIVLNSLANNHLGGESVDVTDLAHPGLFQLAVDAARAIPGLRLAGVDLMTPDLGSVDGAVVLEVNVQANFRVHLCPAYGQSRDVAGAMIDEMVAAAAVPRGARPLPAIPHGSSDEPDHHGLIRRAAKSRGLKRKTIGATTFFYDGRLPVGGMTNRVPTLVGRRAFRISKSKDLTKQMLDATGVPTPAGEEQIDGIAIRAYVVGQRVAAAATGLHAEESVDVTDSAHPDLLQLAVDATRAIPGLGPAGVDLIAPSIDSADGAVVLGLDVRADIRAHHSPTSGAPRDVAGAILDEMIATATSRSRPRSRTRWTRRRRRLLARRRPR